MDEGRCHDSLLFAKPGWAKSGALRLKSHRPRRRWASAPQGRQGWRGRRRDGGQAHIGAEMVWQTVGVGQPWRAAAQGAADRGKTAARSREKPNKGRICLRHGVIRQDVPVRPSAGMGREDGSPCARPRPVGCKVRSVRESAGSGRGLARAPSTARGEADAEAAKPDRDE